MLYLVGRDADACIADLKQQVMIIPLRCEP